jgi:hypothetical protein
MSDELRAVVNEANTLGYTLPSAKTLGNLDVFVKSLKTLNIWNLCDYIRVSAYNDITVRNFALINMVNPTGVLSINNSASYSTLGFMGNGTSAWINTGINLSLTSKYAQSNAARLHVIHTAATSTNKIIDGSELTQQNHYRNDNAVQQRINQSNSDLVAAVDLSGTGLKAIIRDSSSNIRLYNKNVESVRSRNIAARVDSVQVELRTGSLFGNPGISFSLYSSQLSAIQVEGIRTAFNTYLVSIGLTAFA